LKTITPILFPIILTLGVNIFAHGHLTPGGGFPGGAIIASGVLLLLLSDEKYAINAKLFKAQESLAGSGYVVAGLIGLATSGYFLQNFLPTGVIGELFSAGIIPIVYILIGIKVGTEVSSVVNDFFTEGDQ
jgi:multicomponent Na+:H+ antiporter subunit B